MPPTKQEITSAVLVLAAAAEAIRTAGSLPSGTLYAMLMNRVDISGYEKMIGILKSSGLVEEKYHELKWIGPSIT